MNRLLVLIALALPFSDLFAQDASLRGSLQDESSRPLAYSSVVVAELADTTNLNFSLTDDKGQFFFKNLPKGKYTMQILRNGFDLLEDTLELSGELDLGDIRLIKSDITLEEAIVKAKRIPIVFKGDTVVYNTNSFNTKANATVEDMLKELPGISVDKNGTVRTQGENVVKVLVNGKEFFGDDPTKATQNISADAVDKVEVLDRKTDETEFKGIDDGTREKVINLVLKEDANKGYFGKVEAGAGTDDTYRGKFTLNKFNEDNQYTIIGNVNNLNQNGFDWQEYFRMLGGPNGVTLGQRTYWFGQNEWLGQNQEGRQTNAVIGSNMNVKLGKKGTLNASYFFMDRSNDLESNTTGENFLPTTTIYNQSDRNVQSENGQHKLTALYRLNRDTLNFVRLQGEISNVFGEDDTRGFSINTGPEDNLINQTIMNDLQVRSNLNYKGKASYMRKFKKNKHVLSFETGFDKNTALDTSQWANMVSRESLSRGIRLPLEWADDKRGTGFQFYNAASFTYSLPDSNKYYLTLRVENRMANDSFIQDRSNMIQDSLLTDQSPVMGSDYVSTKYKLSFNRRYDKNAWFFGFSLGYLDLIMDRNVSLSEEITGTFSDRIGFFLVDGHTGFRKGQKERFNIWLNSTEQLPTINQLNPVAVISNPLNISTGNLSLSPFVRYSSGLSYMKRNPAKHTTFFGWMNVGFNDNGIITTETRDTNNFSRTLLDNDNNASWAAGDISYSFPIEKLGMDLEFSVGYNNYKYFNVLNDIRYENIRNTFDAGVDVEFIFGPVEWDIGYWPEYNIQQSDLFGSTLSYWRHDISSEIFVELGDRIEISAELDAFLFNGNQFGSQQVVPILNAGIEWSLDSLEKWQLSLVGYDMLNKARSIDRYFFSNGYSETRQNTLTRYFMFNVSYSIRKGKKARRGRNGMIDKR